MRSVRGERTKGTASRMRPKPRLHETVPVVRVYTAAALSPSTRCLKEASSFGSSTHGSSWSARANASPIRPSGAWYSMSSTVTRVVDAESELKVTLPRKSTSPVFVVPLERLARVFVRDLDVALDFADGRRHSRDGGAITRAANVLQQWDEFRPILEISPHRVGAIERNVDFDAVRRFAHTGRSSSKIGHLFLYPHRRRGTTGAAQAGLMTEMTGICAMLDDLIQPRPAFFRSFAISRAAFAPERR